MASTGKFYDYTHIAPPIKMFVVAGGTAGDHTITGITTDDKLIGVSSIYATGAQLSTVGLTAGNLFSEFSITGSNTINNDSGTDTTGAMLLVLYADYNA